MSNITPPPDLPAGYEVMNDKGLYGFSILKFFVC